MGWNDHLHDDSYSDGRVTCDCGAVYNIRESDGTSGCRDIERVYCEFCGRELACHFGECDGRLVDDSAVNARLKQAKLDKDDAIEKYVASHGYDYGTPECNAIYKKWRLAVDAYLSEIRSVHDDEN